MDCRVYFDDRTETARHLANYGLQTYSKRTTDHVAQHGLPPIDGENTLLGYVKYTRR